MNWALLGDRGLQALLAFIVLVSLSALGFVLASLTLRADNNRVARRWAAFEARWDPVMLEILAGSAVAGDLLRLVAPSEHRWFVEYLLRYGRRIRGPERQHLRALARPCLYAISGDLAHRSVERRARAVQAVGELGPDDYREELLAALDDPAPLVAMIAAVTLSRGYREGDAPRVIRSVNRLQLLTNRLLVSMLQRLGPDSAWAFRDVLADPGQPTKLRAVAAKVLTVFNDQEAGDIAVRVLETSGELDLRVASLHLLARVGSAEHLAIARTLAADPAPAVRGAAIRMLGSVGGEEDIPLLVDALDDPVSWVAIHAAEGLRRSGRADMLEAVAQTRRRRSSIIVNEMLFRDGA